MNKPVSAQEASAALPLSSEMTGRTVIAAVPRRRKSLGETLYDNTTAILFVAAVALFGGVGYLIGDHAAKHPAPSALAQLFDDRG